MKKKKYNLIYYIIIHKLKLIFIKKNYICFNLNLEFPFPTFQYYHEVN